MTPRDPAPRCRDCRSWKRKHVDSGVCWSKEVDWHGAVVSEHSSCAQFAPKVIEVAHGPDRCVTYGEIA